MAMKAKSIDSLLRAEGKETTRRRIEFIKPLKSSNSFRCVQYGPNDSHHNKSAVSRSESQARENSLAKEKDAEKGLFDRSHVETNMMWRKVSRYAVTNI